MNRQHLRGFTLMELLVSITVIAILAAMGIPSFRSLMASQRVRTAATNLQIFLNLTRAEALKRNTNITLAPSQSGQWNAGWKIVDPSNATLFTAPAVTAITVNGPASIVYTPSGRVTSASAATFKLSSTDTTDIRCVQVTLTGLGVISRSGC
jgi:type IV fimbrial biogenesis protein FimT